MAVAGDLAVRTRGLRKSYRSIKGRSVGVEHLDLDVPAGGVHGFLGPNGSGKTTTIRMLLGLVRADEGTMHLFGREVPKHLPEVVGRVGAIVEHPKFFPTFSARRNLDLLAEAIGAPVGRVDAVLAEVGLEERSRDRYKTYSLGMKQRLAIGATLLKDPDLLIFDEPTNGLDPAGIREVRDTMRSLADRGRTVLVSSHILAEVQQVADTVSIIARGRLLASGTVADLVGGGGRSVRVGVSDTGTDGGSAGARERAAKVLEAAGHTVRPDGRLLHVDAVTDASVVTRLLATHDLWVDELHPAQEDLESVFLELTGGYGPGGTDVVPRADDAPKVVA
ncbi:ABC transporter ATP-binding protein [Oerskovia sp. KBS0722]|uniref:ABC transporter ATP-binding protein n=1 Tax=Oerskovia sp. KBS0722 TaxID=1179673 RepID=UPI001FEE423A|nr:ATP-binding cassette domain-containing protein [Oerskovia sp. KBS0722]